MCRKRESGQHIVEKYHLNKAIALKAINPFNSVMPHFWETCKKEQGQVSLDRFLLQAAKRKRFHWAIRAVILLVKAKVALHNNLLFIISLTAALKVSKVTAGQFIFLHNLHVLYYFVLYYCIIIILYECFWIAEKSSKFSFIWEIHFYTCK